MPNDEKDRKEQIESLRVWAFQTIVFVVGAVKFRDKTPPERGELVVEKTLQRLWEASEEASGDDLGEFANELSTRVLDWVVANWR